MGTMEFNFPGMEKFQVSNYTSLGTCVNFSPQIFKFLKMWGFFFLKTNLNKSQGKIPVVWIKRYDISSKSFLCPSRQRCNNYPEVYNASRSVCNGILRRCISFILIALQFQTMKDIQDFRSFILQQFTFASNIFQIASSYLIPKNRTYTH